MASLTELKARILRILNDPDGAGYTDTLLLDSVNAAQLAIMPWTPKTASETITGDGTEVSFDLPEDFYDVDAVLIDSTGEIIREAFLDAGATHGDNIEEDNDYLILGNEIVFSKAIDAAATYTLYYRANWTPLEDDDDTTECPAFVHYALCLYAAAYALLPTSVTSGEIRQFGTKVDSGNPEHNPVQRTVEFLMRMFAQEMNRHPTHRKTQRG